MATQERPDNSTAILNERVCSAPIREDDACAEPPLLTDSLDDFIPRMSERINSEQFSAQLDTLPVADFQPATIANGHGGLDPLPRADSTQPHLASPARHIDTHDPALSPALGTPARAPHLEAPSAPIPTSPPQNQAAPSVASAKFNTRLRAAAQVVLQEVLDDFVPQIEAELQRRLEARLDQLVAQRKT